MLYGYLIAIKGEDEPAIKFAVECALDSLNESKLIDVTSLGEIETFPEPKEINDGSF